jgi:parallel beta-helix repeat protein
VFGWGADKTVTVRPSGGDYTTLNAAIVGELIANSDLVTMAGILYIKIEGDWSGGADSAAVDVSDFTDSSSYYVNIYTDSANRAKASGWDTNRYILALSGSHCLSIGDDYTRIDGLQVQLTASSSIYACIRTRAGIGASSDIRISACRCKGVISGTATGYGFFTNDAGSANGYVKIFNCIATDFTGGSGSSAGIYNKYADSTVIYNCTVYNCAIGIDHYQSSYPTTAKNNVVFKCGDDFDAGTGFTIDYNASDDNDGDNNIAESGGGVEWPNDFEGAGTGDFRLKSGSNLVGATTDQSSGLFTDDIEGTTRGASWDVGAFEYVSTGLKITVFTQLFLSIWPSLIPMIWFVLVAWFCIAMRMVNKL